VAATAYDALLQLAIKRVDELRDDEQSGRLKRLDPETPLVYNLPWYWSDHDDWKNILKNHPNPRKEISGDDLQRLLHEIADKTKFGCFPGRRGPQVQLMTSEEQKAAAMKQVVSFISQRIKHIKQGTAGGDSLPGYNASDIQLLETNYPQGAKLLKFDEIMRGVEAQIGTDWKKEIKVDTDYAVSHR
jgi:hypothetical protein